MHCLASFLLSPPFTLPRLTPLQTFTLTLPSTSFPFLPFCPQESVNSRVSPPIPHSRQWSDPFANYVCASMQPPHAHVSVSLPGNPAKRPRGRPRKDGLPPGSARPPIMESSSPFPPESVGTFPKTSVPASHSSRDVASPPPTHVMCRGFPPRVLACSHCRGSKVKCDKKRPSCAR